MKKIVKILILIFILSLKAYCSDTDSIKTKPRYIKMEPRKNMDWVLISNSGYLPASERFPRGIIWLIDGFVYIFNDSMNKIINDDIYSNKGKNYNFIRNYRFVILNDAQFNDFKLRLRTSKLKTNDNDPRSIKSENIFISVWLNNIATNYEINNSYDYDEFLNILEKCMDENKLNFIISSIIKPSDEYNKFYRLKINKK